MALVRVPTMDQKYKFATLLVTFAKVHAASLLQDSEMVLAMAPASFPETDRVLESARAFVMVFGTVLAMNQK